MVVISVYTYGVKIIKKFRWESGFLWGCSMEPPLCTNGSAGYLMQLTLFLVGLEKLGNRIGHFDRFLVKMTRHENNIRAAYPRMYAVCLYV